MTPADIKAALEDMRHAVGYDYPGRRKALPWRNYYAANLVSPESRRWDILCGLGLAVKGRVRGDDSGLVYYHVSEVGLALVKKRAVKPCKESR